MSTHRTMRAKFAVFVDADAARVAVVSRARSAAPPTSNMTSSQLSPHPDDGTAPPTAPFSITASAVTAMTSSNWIRFAGKEYLFVMDATRRSDLGRDDAHASCRVIGTAAPSGFRQQQQQQQHGAAVTVSGLAAVETEAELEFVKEEIRRRVVENGQEFAHEQWWTAGRSMVGRWVWDVDGFPPGMMFNTNCLLNFAACVGIIIAY